MIRSEKLTKNTAIIVVFWWLILTGISIGWALFSWDDWISWFGRLDNVALGIGIGVGLSLLFMMGVRLSLTWNLRQQSRYGLISLLGRVPYADPPPKRMDATSKSLSWLAAYPDIKDWYAGLQKKHPLHAKAFVAIYQTLASKPRLPASSVPGGHGDLTLLQHSLNVCRSALQLSGHFKYEGAVSRRHGNSTIPPRDQEFKFSPNDPLIGIIGLAHDIGKLVCFKTEGKEDHIVTEVVGYHDRQGGLLLGRFPEIFDLPFEDRMALIEAVTHYHAPDTMPIDMLSTGPAIRNDRTMALMEILIKADRQTGEQEGGVKVDYYHFDDAAAKPEEQRVQHKERLWGALYDLLLKPDRVNGGNKELRIGFKHGNKVYLLEEATRAALEHHLGYATLTTRHGSRMSRTTSELMEALDERGVLVKQCQHPTDGHKFFTKRSALFVVRFKAPSTDKKDITYPAMIIFEYPECIPALAAHDDAPYKPVIERPTFGWQRALKKGQDETEAIAAEVTEDIKAAQAVEATSQAAATAATSGAVAIEDDGPPALPSDDPTETDWTLDDAAIIAATHTAAVPPVALVTPASAPAPKPAPAFVVDAADTDKVASEAVPSVQWDDESVGYDFDDDVPTEPSDIAGETDASLLMPGESAAESGGGDMFESAAAQKKEKFVDDQPASPKRMTILMQPPESFELSAFDQAKSSKKRAKNPSQAAKEHALAMPEAAKALDYGIHAIVRKIAANPQALERFNGRTDVTIEGVVWPYAMRYDLLIASGIDKMDALRDAEEQLAKGAIKGLLLKINPNGNMVLLVK